MSYRVAIASSNGKVANDHFGRAEQFYIIEVGDDNNYQLVEVRRLSELCEGGGHEDGAMLRNMEALSDCSCVLVSRIGPKADELLTENGITVFVIQDYIEDAIKKLIMAVS